MNVKKKFFLLFLLAAFPCAAAQGSSFTGAGSAYQRPAAPKTPSNEEILKQLRTNLKDLKYQVNNQDAEIQALQAKLENQEVNLEESCQKLEKELCSKQEHNRVAQVDLENSIASVKESLQSVVSDLRLIKTQANETIKALGEQKERLTERLAYLEAKLEVQAQNLKLLESALQSLMELFQSKTPAKKAETAVAGSENSYKVQPGDTLEKIARLHKVSLSALKQANQIEADDKIRVNQTLKIP